MSISVLRARLRVKRLQKGLKSSLNRIYVTYSMAARDVWHIHILALGATPLGPRDMYMPLLGTEGCTSGVIPVEGLRTILTASEERVQGLEEHCAVRNEASVKVDES